MRPATTPPTSAKRHRGRPRTRANTALIQALIERQNSMARRTAAKINSLLETHASAVGVARAWVDHVDLARKTLLVELPARIQARVPHLDQTVLRSLIEEALEEIVVHDEQRTLARAPEPPEPRAVVRPSPNLAEARAQAALLIARLSDLKGRIVPLKEVWP